MRKKEQPLGASAEHRAGVAKPRRARLLEAAGIDARHLGRDIGTQAHHAARILIHDLEGLKIELGPTGNGEESTNSRSGGSTSSKPARWKRSRRARRKRSSARARGGKIFIDALWQ